MRTATRWRSSRRSDGSAGETPGTRSDHRDWWCGMLSCGSGGEGGRTVAVTEEPDGETTPGPVSPEVLQARIRGLQHGLGQLLDSARQLTKLEHHRAVQLHRQLQLE